MRLTSMKGDQLPVNANAVVGKFAANGVFGGQIGVLVVPEPLAQEVGHQQARVAFVGVPVGQAWPSGPSRAARTG
jgi:hypothetical protein